MEKDKSGEEAFEKFKLLFCHYDEEKYCVVNNDININNIKKFFLALSPQMTDSLPFLYVHTNKDGLIDDSTFPETMRASNGEDYLSEFIPVYLSSNSSEADKLLRELVKVCSNYGILRQGMTYTNLPKILQRCESYLSKYNNHKTE